MHDSLLHAIDLYLMFVIWYLKYIDVFVIVCVCVCVCRIVSAENASRVVACLRFTLLRNFKRPPWSGDLGRVMTGNLRKRWKMHIAILFYAFLNLDWMCFVIRWLIGATSQHRTYCKQGEPSWKGMDVSICLNLYSISKFIYSWGIYYKLLKPSWNEEGSHKGGSWRTK